ncbi:uncharacterized protein LOC132744693 [Ruditapes philippinarum]|uniref:uncharacterized protein LOC132744693 n=1 Tax=Ruditapes philippinarum TaxID=129788 RepID=UPI00295AA85D|nr:uncharacterized protein LOC132744693 [Ruditapes philippinarum]
MERKHKEIFLRYLPKFVDQVDPQQLLTYLPCLSKNSRETVEAAQRSTSRSYAAQVLHSHLERRPEGFRQLVLALRHENVDCTELADLLDPQHCYDPSNEGQSQTQNNNVSSPACHYGSPVQLYNVQVPSGAAGFTPRSPGTCDLHNMRQGQMRPTPKYELDTPWGKLPGGVNSTLRKFDAEQSRNKIDDLGGELGFNIEEINEIKSEVVPGESKTLAFLERWIHSQHTPVILGDIMKIFHNLDRLDILHELENKTGVKFVQEEENGDSAISNASIVPVGELPVQSRKGPVNTDTNPNINVPLEKVPSNSVKVCNLEATDMPQIHPGNIERPNKENLRPIPQSKSDITETFRHMSQNESEITSIADDSIEECKRNKKFLGYRREDIENRRSQGPQNLKDNFQADSKMRTDQRKISGELASESGMREGLPSPHVSNDEIDTRENNLNRSVSNCSSSTENNSCDSLPDKIFENNLQSCDEKRPSDSLACNVNEEDKPNIDVDYTTSPIEENLETDFMPEMGDKTENISELKKVDKPVLNLAQLRNGWQNSDDDIEKLQTKFSLDNFEQKILRPWQNYSDIISQNDPSESREVSEKKSTGSLDSIATVDHSLRDAEANRPKLASLSGEMKSLEKKARKAYPGQHQLVGASIDTVSCMDYVDNPTGSFKFDWEVSPLQSEDLQTDGDAEQELRHLEQTPVRHHESDALLHQPADQQNVEVNITKRGTSSLVMSETKNQKINNEKADVLTEKSDQSKIHSESNNIDEKNLSEGLRNAATTKNESEAVMKNAVELQGEKLANSGKGNTEPGAAFFRNQTESFQRNKTEDASQIFSLKSMSSVVKFIYENCL